MILFKRRSILGRIFGLSKYKLIVRMWREHAEAEKYNAVELDSQPQVQALTNAYLSFKSGARSMIVALDGHLAPKDANGEKLFSTDAPGHRLRWACTHAEGASEFLNAKIGWKTVHGGGDYIGMDALIGPQFTYPTWSGQVAVNLIATGGI